MAFAAADVDEEGGWRGGGGGRVGSGYQVVLDGVEVGGEPGAFALAVA